MKSNSKGVRLPEKAVVVAMVKRVNNPNAAAWEGQTEDGQLLHIGYRPGELVVMEAGKAENGIRWRTLVRCKPELLEAEAELARWDRDKLWQHKPADSRMREHLREHLRIEAENRITAKVRAWSWWDAVPPARTNGSAGPERQKSGPAKVRWAQVREWLELREEHWEDLQQLGLTGGGTRVKVEAWWDGGHPIGCGELR